MANPKGNPYIAHYGRDTRFGQPLGPDPQAAGSHTHGKSVRRYLRYLMGVRVNISDLDNEIENLGKELQLTVAQMAAVILVQKMARGEDWALDHIENSIDGKVPVGGDIDFDIEEAEKIIRTYAGG